MQSRDVIYQTLNWKSMSGKFKSGVLTGAEVKHLLDYANEQNFALPAVNVVSTNSVNAVLETAREVNSKE